MRRGILFALALWALAAPPRADAQMFGPRQLGGFLSRQQTPGAMSNPAEAMIQTSGSLSGTERFLRANRDAQDFVGTDLAELRAFVGATQARMRRTTPAAATAREATIPNVNREQSESDSATSMYAPRLTLSPELSGPSPSAVTRSLEDHLLHAPIQWLRPLEVSMQGRTAILRGEVATPRERALAEAWVRFEPGVSAVQNDLIVEPPAPTPMPPAPRPEPSPEFRLDPAN